jgi:hypothetical protein
MRKKPKQGMHFTYLGLPMGSPKQRVEHYAPLMDRVERQLTSISNMFTHVGHLQLVNSVMSSMLTYTMCSVMVPIAVIEYFERAQRHCMWRNSDSNAKSKPLVAWKKCSMPKRKGGLGVINLRSQNTVLPMKHLDKFYNRRDIPWVNLIWDTYYQNGEVSHATKDKGSFWWKDVLKLCEVFRGIATCKVGNGTTILFWSNIIREQIPTVILLCKKQKKSVAQFLTNNRIEEQFHLPLNPSFLGISGDAKNYLTNPNFKY